MTINSVTVLSLIVVNVLLLSMTVKIECKADTLADLCSDPYIHSANRLTNETIRIYRGEYYWDLVGLPDKIARPIGPFKIWFDYMAPVSETTSIMTIVGGRNNEHVFKFDKTRYWEWKADGKQVIGQKDGVDMSKGNFPPEGFNCVFNDGSLDKRWPGPRMIAFQGIFVTYWDTNYLPFRLIGGLREGKGGKYDERLPHDITACTAFKMSGQKNNKGTPFWVYLFQRNKYCFRPITGSNGCPEWRDNRELFGCPGKYEALGGDGDKSIDGSASHRSGSGEDGSGSDKGDGNKSTGALQSYSPLYVTINAIVVLLLTDSQYSLTIFFHFIFIFY